jgi:hypothetical protein
MIRQDISYHETQWWVDLAARNGLDFDQVKGLECLLGITSVHIS